MNAQGAGERLNRREEPLLQTRDQKTGGGLDTAGLSAKALFPKQPIFIQQGYQSEFRCIPREISNSDLNDFSFREPSNDLPEVVL
jgi:hypothetical protein